MRKQYSDTAHGNLELRMSTRNTVKRVDLGIISLIPDLLISVWAADWRNKQLRIFSMRFVSRSAEGLLHRRCVRPDSHVTHDANLLPERINAVVSGGDEVLGRFLRHLAVFTDAAPPPPPPPPLLCRQTSSRKKPAARMDTPAGVKGRGPRLPVTAVICTLVSKQQLRFQPPPPGVGLLQQVSMFQLCPCVSSDGRHGSRLVPPGRAAFQPPLSVIHLYIICQGPAPKDSWWPSGLDAVALRCLPTRRFTPTRGR